MKQLSSLAGVSDISVYNCRHNRVTPSLRFLKRIAPVLGENIAYLGCYDLLPGETIGQRVMRARLGLGMTQEEFSKMLGVDESTIVNWERGERKPVEKYIKKLEQFIGPT